jgi:hypothetical protein
MGVVRENADEITVGNHPVEALMTFTPQIHVRNSEEERDKDVGATSDRGSDFDNDNDNDGDDDDDDTTAATPKWQWLAPDAPEESVATFGSSLCYLQFCPGQHAGVARPPRSYFFA